MSLHITIHHLNLLVRESCRCVLEERRDFVHLGDVGLDGNGLAPALRDGFHHLQRYGRQGIAKRTFQGAQAATAAAKIRAIAAASVADCAPLL